MRLNFIKKRIEPDDVGQYAFFVPFRKSQDNFNKIKEGEKISTEIKRGRNALHNAKYWASCQLVANNHDIYNTKDKVHIYCCYKTGYVDTIVIDDRVHMFPKSVSFANCSQDDFQEFYDASLAVMAGLLDVSIDDIEKNYLEFM